MSNYSGNPQRKVTAAPAALRTGATAAGAAPQAAGVYVRGDKLVVRDGASLPDRCIRCNAPAADGRVVKRFAYNEDESGPGAAVLIPVIGRLFWIIWLISRINTRSYLTVSYCVCGWHRTVKLLAIAAMILGMISGTYVTVMAFANSGKSTANPRGDIDTTTIFIGVLIFFAGALSGMAIAGLKVASGMQNSAELTGAGKPFMDSMPKFGKTVRTPRY